MKKLELGPGRTKYIIDEPQRVWEIPISRNDAIIMPYKKSGALIISNSERNNGVAKFSFGEAITGHVVVVEAVNEVLH